MYEVLDLMHVVLANAEQMNNELMYFCAMPGGCLQAFANQLLRARCCCWRQFLLA